MNKRFSRWAVLPFSFLMFMACSKNQDAMPDPTDQDTVIVTPIDTIPIALDTMTMFKNDTGYLQGRLPDSTEVFLNAKSYLQYDSGKVSLQGNAYFKVPAYSHKFYIRYDSIIIKGSDVEFTYNSYYHEPFTDIFDDFVVGIRLTIIKGTLEVSNMNGSTHYRAGESIEVGRKRIVISHDWDAEEETGWLNGHYNIKTISIAKLSKLVAFQYGVNTTASYIEAKGTVHNIYLDLKKPVSDLPNEPTFQNQVKMSYVEDINGKSWAFTNWPDAEPQ